jgi:hypothetical protein
MIEEIEPSSYEEARRHKKWQDARLEEMSALRRNETWDLVPGTTPISSKWV